MVGNKTMGQNPPARSNMKVQILTRQDLRLHRKGNAKHQRRHNDGKRPIRRWGPDHNKMRCIAETLVIRGGHRRREERGRNESSHKAQRDHGGKDINFHNRLSP